MRSGYIGRLENEKEKDTEKGQLWRRTLRQHGDNLNHDGEATLPKKKIPCKEKQRGTSEMAMAKIKLRIFFLPLIFLLLTQ